MTSRPTIDEAPKRIQRKRSAGWAAGHSAGAKCLTCELPITTRPTNCAEPKHESYVSARQRRNNAYRKSMRTAARERGEVYRVGRWRPEKCADYQRRINEGYRSEIMRRLGSVGCARCGFTDKRALQFDHIHGGGRHHRKSIGAGSKYLRALLRMLPSALQQQFQVLCANCNVIKRYENGEHRSPRPTAKITEEGE